MILYVYLAPGQGQKIHEDKVFIATQAVFAPISFVKFHLIVLW